MEKLAMRIAGEIALSDKPGGTMKKWREIFLVTQADLGKYIGISPSTISDYEGNRRKSPGIGVVRRFVDALIQIDLARGGRVVQKLREGEPQEQFFEVHEFATSITGDRFAKLIEGKVVANEEVLPQKKIYGYTLMNSIKVILEVPYTDLPKIFGSVAERAFIFTEVSSGRSPMVVIRINPVKPSVVVLHRVAEVDALAIKIAEREQIPLIITKMDLKKMTEILKKI